MAFSTGNCKMQHHMNSHWCHVLRQRRNLIFMKQSVTYIYAYIRTAFSLLFSKKVALNIEICEVYKKQVDICSKNCGLFRSYVLLLVFGDKIDRMFVNLYFAILNTQYHIEIWDNLSQEVFGKHINTSAQVSNSLKLSKKLQLTAKEFFRTELLLVRDIDGDRKLKPQF